MTIPRSDACLECGIPFREVAPRNIITVTEEAKMHPSKSVALLLGSYCSTDCALRAYERGIPRHL